MALVDWTALAVSHLTQPLEKHHHAHAGHCNFKPAYYARLFHDRVRDLFGLMPGFA